jgi:hypothetical protein
VFDGSHSWPPPDICSQAIEWLELRAMRARHRPTDSAWVRVRLQTDLARAAELEQLGQSAEALRLYEAVTRDYPTSPEMSTAAERAGKLRNTPAVKHFRAEERKLADWDRRQAADLQRVLRWARSQPNPPTSERLMRKLEIAKLQETAKRRDSLHAASAQRLLARIFVWLAFYEPRAYLNNHSPGRALTMFEAATRIGPIQGESCALLLAALHAATPEQQMRLSEYCPRD